MVGQSRSTSVEPRRRGLPVLQPRRWWKSWCRQGSELVGNTPDVLGEAEAHGGILRRRVDVEGPTGPVPGVVYMPAVHVARLPVVLLGHGGGSGKDDPRWQEAGGFLAAHVAAAVLCIDAPFHGERAIPDGPGTDTARAVRRALAEPTTAVNLAADWRAALRPLRQVDGVEVDRLGYFGFSMGTVLGVSVCAELDVRAAVFAGGGVFDPAVVGRFIAGSDPTEIAQETRQFETRSRLLLDAAAKLDGTEILQLVMLDDEVFNIDGALELFAAFSGPKRMAAWPGGHDALPGEALEYAAWFLSRTLSR